MERGISVVGLTAGLLLCVARIAGGQETPDDLTRGEWRCERQASRSLSAYWAGIEACVAECRAARASDPARICGPFAFDSSTEVCIERHRARARNGMLRRCAGEACPECYGSCETVADSQLTDARLGFGQSSMLVRCDDGSSPDGLNADERRCQERIAKEGSRLVRSARRCLEECHERRQDGRVDGEACDPSALGISAFDAKAQACVDDAKKRFVTSCPTCFDPPECWGSVSPPLTCHAALADALSRAVEPEERLLCVDQAHCGDGRVSGVEECEPFSAPEQCAEGDACTESCSCAPIPDVCSDVTTIPGFGGVFPGETSGLGATASSCGGESAPEKVFAWTAPTSGNATIDTCGSGFDAIVSVRTSCEAGSSEVGCSSQGCSSQGSRLEVEVDAGTTYFIFVDGPFAASGDFMLAVTPPAVGGCQVRLRADLEYDAGSPEAAGARALIGYPTAASLPGSLDDASVAGRVTRLNPVGGGLFGVSDNDDRVPSVLTAGLVSLDAPIAPGPFVEVLFDCAVPLLASDFSCTADLASSSGELVPASCALSVLPPSSSAD